MIVLLFKINNFLKLNIFDLVLLHSLRLTLLLIIDSCVYKKCFLAHKMTKTLKN